MFFKTLLFSAVLPMPQAVNPIAVVEPNDPGNYADSFIAPVSVDTIDADTFPSTSVTPVVNNGMCFTSGCPKVYQITKNGNCSPDQFQIFQNIYKHAAAVIFMQNRYVI